MNNSTPTNDELRRACSTMPEWLSLHQIEIMQEALLSRLSAPPLGVDLDASDIVELQGHVAQKIAVLDWIQSKIGTGWECDQCGYSTYHQYAFTCDNCAAEMPIEHVIAFKLGASAPHPSGVEPTDDYEPTAAPPAGEGARNEVIEAFLGARIFENGRYKGWRISGKNSINELARKLDPEHQKGALQRLDPGKSDAEATPENDVAAK